MLEELKALLQELSDVLGLDVEVESDAESVSYAQLYVRLSEDNPLILFDLYRVEHFEGSREHEEPPHDEPVYMHSAASVRDAAREVLLEYAKILINDALIEVEMSAGDEDEPPYTADGRD